MSVIYTEPRFISKDALGRGYERYEREVYCVCGKKIGIQTKYNDWNNFCFDRREVADYKFCPYCGKELKLEGSI